jgi:U4/U6.U5 tri-snRNP-associated protein 2
LKGLLAQRFAELIRKIWDSKNFKNHVSPHEVLQAISLASKAQFKIVKQSDSINFLSWFFNTLHDYLANKSGTNSSTYSNNLGIISKSFQGKILIETFTHIKEHGNQFKLSIELKRIQESEFDLMADMEIVIIEGLHYRVERKLQPFYFLTLELPKTPLFKDSSEKISIPQISIFSLFKKYDGNTFTDDPIKGIKRRYHLVKLPVNLILYFKRFEKNQYFVEKNNTIINFPIKNLSLKGKS